MRPALTALAGSLAVLAGLAACSSHTSDLRLSAMIPDQGTTAQPIQAEISGQGLQPLSQTDFQKSGKSSLDAQFQAALTKRGGTTPIPLTDVTLTARHTLAVTIPANLEHGDYALTVTDPAGRTARLDPAFKVVTPAEAVKGFQVSLSDTVQHEGVAFTVTVTAVDDTAQVADGFTGAVTLSDVSNTVTPTTLSGFRLGRFQGQVEVKRVIQENKLTVKDALGHVGESVAFRVDPGPAIQLAFASAPVSIAAGQCSGLLTLEFRDALGTASAVTQPVALQLRWSTSGSVLFYPDAACSSAPITGLSIAAGQTTGAFAFKADAASSLTLRVDPDTFPSVEQVETVQ